MCWSRGPAHSREWGCESLFLPRKLPVTGLISREFWEEEPGWLAGIIWWDLGGGRHNNSSPHIAHLWTPAQPCQPFLPTFSQYTQYTVLCIIFSVATSSFPVIFQNMIERNTWEPCVCISHNIFVWHNYDSGHNYSFRSLLRKHLPNPRHTVLQLLISTVGHESLWEWYG